MRWLLAGLVGAVVLYFLTGVVQVRRGERAVVRRFGRVLEYQPEPGLWVGLPWGMDRVDRVDVDGVRSVTVGGDEVGEESVPSGQLLTGDHNLVNVQATLYYKVRPDRVADFALQQDRVPGILARAAEAAVSEWVAGRHVDVVLLTGKSLLPRVLKERVRERIDAYGLGVTILDPRVGQLAPPDEVKSAFDDVARAQTGVATARYRAEQEAASRQRLARSDAYRVEQSARAYAHARRVLAEQDANRFLDRLAQYQAAKGSNPHYLRQLWQQERGRLFAKMRENGQIDLLDHHLGQGGLDVLTAPRLPDKR